MNKYDLLVRLETQQMVTENFGRLIEHQESGANSPKECVDTVLLLAAAALGHHPDEERSAATCSAGNVNYTGQHAIDLSHALFGNSVDMEGASALRHGINEWPTPRKTELALPASSEGKTEPLLTHRDQCTYEAALGSSVLGCCCKRTTPP